MNNRSATPVRPVRTFNNGLCSCPPKGVSRMCNCYAHSKRAEILYTLGFNPLKWGEDMPAECAKFKGTNRV